MIYSGGSRYLLSFFSVLQEFHCDLLVFILLSTQGGSLAEKHMLFHQILNVCSHAFFKYCLFLIPLYAFFLDVGLSVFLLWFLLVSHPSECLIHTSCIRVLSASPNIFL